MCCVKVRVISLPLVGKEASLSDKRLLDLSVNLRGFGCSRVHEPLLEVDIQRRVVVDLNQPSFSLLIEHDIETYHMEKFGLQNFIK